MVGLVLVLVLVRGGGGPSVLENTVGFLLSSMLLLVSFKCC